MPEGNSNNPLTQSDLDTTAEKSTIALERHEPDLPFIYATEINVSHEQQQSLDAINTALHCMNVVRTRIDCDLLPGLTTQNIEYLASAREILILMNLTNGLLHSINLRNEYPEYDQERENHIISNQQKLNNILDKIRQKLPVRKDQVAQPQVYGVDPESIFELCRDVGSRIHVAKNEVMGGDFAIKFLTTSDSATDEELNEYWDVLNSGFPELSESISESFATMNEFLPQTVLDSKTVVEAIQKVVTKANKNVNLQVELNVEGDDFQIIFSRPLLKQMVSNLIQNASRSSERKRSLIRMKHQNNFDSNVVQNQYNEAGRAIISLKATDTSAILSMDDNGVGMPEDIEINGFQIGKSSLGGTGRGIGQDIVRAKKVYRIEDEHFNRRDENNNILGAHVGVIIPRSG